MSDDLQLNVSLLRRRVPNLTTAAGSVGLRAATVSNLCTGKIPVGRAEVRTLAALATLARCSLDELIIRGNATSMVETGIKALDLFSPIVKGGVIGFVARPGMGQLVLLAELFHNVRQRGMATVFWMPPQESLGIDDVVHHVEMTRNSLDEVFQSVSDLAAERDVLLGVDRSMVLSGDLWSLQEQLWNAGTRRVTIALVDTLGEVVDEDMPYGPLDSLLRFDMDLAARNLYPAIDPLISTSTLTEGDVLDTNHATLQLKARKLLRRYRELRQLVTVRGIEKLPVAETLTYQRGERLEAFLTQPFYVAEPLTKSPGVWMSFRDTLEDVRRVLDGHADNLEPSQLRYIGRLDQHR